MSIFGIFTMPALQIWPCHVTRKANFKKILFFPNSVFNIRKSYKISSRKALYFRSYQPKTSRGVENTPQSFRVNLKQFMDEITTIDLENTKNGMVKVLQIFGQVDKVIELETKRRRYIAELRKKIAEWGNC